jgi:hypothetical protein
MHCCDTDLREIAMENQALSQDNVVTLGGCVSNFVKIDGHQEVRHIFWNPSTYNEDYHG